MIAITPEKALRLTPRKGKDTPELELPLQFGYVCPQCEHVIHGAIQFTEEVAKNVNLNSYAVPTLAHQYPLEYRSKTVALMNGLRGQLFWEEGHFVTGYDPYYHTKGLTRCKFTRGWHHRSPRVIAAEVFAVLTKQQYLYVNTQTNEQFTSALQEYPAISVPFLDGLAAEMHPRVFVAIKDECEKSNPVYLLAKDGLTASRLEAIVVGSLANQQLV